MTRHGIDTSKRNGRLASLDSIRGLAALIVVVQHLLIVWLPPRAEANTFQLCLKMLVQFAHPAVITFFVLSGFVLTLSVARNPNVSLPRFFFKRIVRLYPPLIAAILVSAGLYVLAFSASNPLFWNNWASPPSASLIARHILLTITQSDDSTLDGPIWSLAHEVRISAFFPALVFAVSSRPRLALACTVLGYFAAGFLIDALQIPYPWLLGITTLGSAALSLHYLLSFVVGVYLAREYRASRFAVDLSARVELAALALALVLVAFRSDLLNSISAALLLISALRGSILNRVLERSLFVWLGKVSYSLYLFHIPVALTILHAGYSHATLPSLLLLSLAASLGCADLAYRCIEEPTIRMAQRIRITKPVSDLTRGTAVFEDGLGP